MSLEEQQRLEASYVMQTYARKPVEFVSGQGMKLFDDKGKEYLDFIAGIGAVSLGHCDPVVTHHIVEQAQKLLQVSNYYYVEHRGQLAQTINNLLSASSQSGADNADNAGQQWQSFFCNSGAEANEGAIKLARAYGNKLPQPATTIVCAKRSFHGRTLATLFATGQAGKQEAFTPAVEGFVHVPINDIAALQEALDQIGVCALLLEPIQGEGGVYPCTTEYIQQARRLTRERKQLLILDEVQTGIYRTGTPFCFQRYGIVPDVVTMAKGMGGGFPLGAVAAQNSIAGLLAPGSHGSTFGGNALACAAAYGVLQRAQELNIASNVQEVGAYLHSQLQTLPHVTEVRGAGLMLATQLDADIAPAVVDAALDAGLVLNCVAPAIMRFLPPLICTTQDVDILIQRLTPILERM